MDRLMADNATRIGDVPMPLSFETASPQYDWLNRMLAIGIGHRQADGPVYSVFEIL
jgi:hypothetical protein